MEIERKFLVKARPPNWKGRSGSKIRQGYFHLCAKDLEIRLREKGSQCFITVKSGHGKVRREEEIRISREHFKHLWPLVRGASVVKTRYRLPHAGRIIELNVYGGRHRGLMTAEVEFPSTRNSNSFEPPEWLGREITEDRRYSNESLANRGRP